jgi:hypothetical protein
MEINYFNLKDGTIVTDINRKSILYVTGNFIYIDAFPLYYSVAYKEIKKDLLKFMQTLACIPNENYYSEYNGYCFHWEVDEDRGNFILDIHQTRIIFNLSFTGIKNLFQFLTEEFQRLESKEEKTNQD